MTPARQGALDVVQLAVMMKKGRAGIRLEVLSDMSAAGRLERRLLQDTTTLGVRRTAVTRRTLDDKNPGGWVPAQKITVEEALTAYTATAAFASFESAR